MAGWNHWPDEHGLEQAPGVGDGQGSLACCRPWGQKESDTTERLNWTELNQGFPGGSSGKEHTCQCRRHKRHRFDPWVRKIPWRRACQLTPMFLPKEEPGGSAGSRRVRHNWSDLPCMRAIVIPITASTKIKYTILKFMWSHKSPRITKTILRKIKSWKQHTPWLQTIEQKYSNQNSWYWPKSDT